MLAVEWSTVAVVSRTVGLKVNATMKSRRNSFTLSGDLNVRLLRVIQSKRDVDQGV